MNNENTFDTSADVASDAAKPAAAFVPTSPNAVKPTGSMPKPQLPIDPNDHNVVITVTQAELRARAESKAVTESGVDDVYLSRCVYRNMRNTRSLTVHHLQRRLQEEEHHEAVQDRDGFYGDHVRNAVREYQEANGLTVTDHIDAATFEKIFENDSNVRVHA